jgi:hypothetical protein
MSFSGHILAIISLVSHIKANFRFSIVESIGLYINVKYVNNSSNVNHY